MKKRFSLLLMALITALLLTLVSCDGSSVYYDDDDDDKGKKKVSKEVDGNKDDKDEKDGEDDEDGEDDNQFLMMTGNEAVQARAAELAEEGEGLPDINVTEKLKVLSWYPIDESSPTAELFKAKYGVPDQANGDNVIELNEVLYENRYTELTALVQSGDSPDMIPFEERNFPYGVWKGQYAPVDDVIDFSGSEWDNTRDVIELFKWGGKNYAPVSEISNSSAMLYYRESVRMAAGLPDPQQLWKENNWTWDTFKAMCQDFSVLDEKWGILGTYVDEAAVLSTGTGLVSIENGKLKSNMSDPRIERAMDFVQELALNDYRYPYHRLSDFAIKATPFREGNLLFWGDGPWLYPEKIEPVVRADDLNEKYGEDEVRVVPFPRDPNADKYYQRGKHDTLMLVAGSENKKGYQAWQQCAAVAASDENMRAIRYEKEMSDLGWTEKQMYDREAILNETMAVWDFKNGIGEDIAAIGDTEVEQLTKWVYTFGEEYSIMRDKHESVILNRIDEINGN